MRYLKFLIFLPAVVFFISLFLENIWGIIIAGGLIIAANVYSTRLNLERWVRVVHYIAMLLTFGIFLLKYSSHLR